MNKETIKYWVKASQHDYKTMIGLFQIRRYSDSLFYGHIVLEKILKALVIQERRKQAPYTHNLIFLAGLTKLDLSQDTINLLIEVNRFNIRARYPDIKFEFYKACDKKYTEKYLKEIKNLYKFLCQKIK